MLGSGKARRPEFSDRVPETGSGARREAGTAEDPPRGEDTGASELTQGRQVAASRGDAEGGAEVDLPRVGHSQPWSLRCCSPTTSSRTARREAVKLFPRNRNASKNKAQEGHLGGSAVEHLPWAQGSRDRVPHWAPCKKPASPFTFISLSLCVS